MQVKCASDLPNASDASSHITPSVFWETDRGVEGTSSKRPTWGHLNEHDYQIRTTNNGATPEAITKKKLAFEVAKLVKRHLESIRVRATIISINSFLKSTWVGRTGVQRPNFGKYGVDETGTRLESILATGTLLRGSCSRPRFPLIRGTPGRAQCTRGRRLFHLVFCKTIQTFERTWIE